MGCSISYFFFLLGDLKKRAFSSKGKGELSHYTMTTTNEGPTTIFDYFHLFSGMPLRQQGAKEASELW